MAFIHHSIPAGKASAMIGSRMHVSSGVAGMNSVSSTPGSNQVWPRKIWRKRWMIAFPQHHAAQPLAGHRNGSRALREGLRDHPFDRDSWSWGGNQRNHETHEILNPADRSFFMCRMVLIFRVPSILSQRTRACDPDRDSRVFGATRGLSPGNPMPRGKGQPCRNVRVESAVHLLFHFDHGGAGGRKGWKVRSGSGHLVSVQRERPSLHRRNSKSPITGS